MSVRGFNTGSGVEQYDYDFLDNRPKINGVELEGDQTTEDLGITLDISFVGNSLVINT